MEKKTIIVIIVVIVLILIALFIAIPVMLVMVGLTMQTTGNFEGMSESTSRMSWRSAVPFSIADWDKKGSELTLAIKNNSGQKLSLDSVTVEKTIEFNSEEIAPESTKTIKITGLSNCSPGQKYIISKHDIEIIYSTEGIKELSQFGMADIVGTCS